MSDFLDNVYASDFFDSWIVPIVGSVLVASIFFAGAFLVAGTVELLTQDETRIEVVTPIGPATITGPGAEYVLHSAFPATVTKPE